MNRLYALLTGLCLILICSFAQPVHATNSAAYEQRRSDYITTCLINFGIDALPIQAYQNLPIDTASLNYLLDHIRTDGDADFRIVQATRVLFLTQSTHTYDSAILASLNSQKYWINSGDSTHVYWSENHMCMWMGSDWLLHESYGRTVDTALHTRLVHYLDIKNRFGFYEFNSSVYLPYCLSGLLNLADFAQDPQIKALATSAAQKLMSDYLLRVTNDQGVFFPAAGRNYYGKYETPYGQNHNNLIWLLTGMGQMPGGASHCGAFLATSQIPVDTVSNSWVRDIDTVYYNGHTLDSSFVINAGQDTLDKIVFHWSSGAYFSPTVAMATGGLLTDSNLWTNYTFQAFTALKSIPLALYPSISENLGVISKSSVISGETLALFKHKSITLSSIQDFWKGKVGFQQHPCVANVGTTAVFVASGQVYQNWSDRPEDNANSNLPYVHQHRNMALLMYRPDTVPDILPYHNHDVALHWRAADFDESLTDSLWFIGRQGASYAAARMYCIGQIDSLAGCHYTTDGQSYVIVVGDSDIYGSFQHFKDVIHASQFSDRRYYDTAAQQSVYYAQVTIDTVTMSYAWGRDSALGVGIHDISTASSLHIYPNPATNRVTIAPENGDMTSLQVSDLMGQIVYTYDGKTLTDGRLTIDTQHWPQGLYVISGENAKGRFVQKMVKE